MNITLRITEQQQRQTIVVLPAVIAIITDTTSIGLFLTPRMCTISCPAPNKHLAFADIVSIGLAPRNTACHVSQIRIDNLSALAWITIRGTMEMQHAMLAR